MASAISAYSSIASFLSTTTTTATVTPPPPSLPVWAPTFSSISISKPVEASSSSFLISFSSCKSKSSRNQISPPSLLRRRLRAAAAASSSVPSGTQKKNEEEEEDKKKINVVVEDRIRQVHSMEEFDAALLSAGKKLVVVEYATSKSHDKDEKIYPFLVQLSRTCGDVEFLLVLGDESEDTRALCRREKIEKAPHFAFYKDTERVHDEEGGIVGPDELMGDVLYYGNSHSEVIQLHSREDADSLIAQHHHHNDNKLIVLDVGLKHCGPCVKVYPTVIKLSRSMAGTVVFARMNGDENDSCMQFLKDMEVIQVPTFLFIRDGRICGRYVGSGKGELIGEILRYQGVRVTY